MLFDGKPVATAENDGQGGCTNVWSIRPKGGSPTEANVRAYNEALAYAKSLGPITGKPFDDGSAFTYEVTLEHVVDDLANEAMLRKDVEGQLRRGFKKKAIYIENGQLWNSKPKNAAVIGEAFFALVQKMHPTATILNRMPLAQAVDAYIAVVKSADEEETA